MVKRREDDGYNTEAFDTDRTYNHGDTVVLLARREKGNKGSAIRGLLETLDFIDDKFLETRKSKDLTYAQRIAVYNTLIDLQEFIKKQMDDEAKHNHDISEFVRKKLEEGAEERNGTGLYC